LYCSIDAFAHFSFGKKPVPTFLGNALAQISDEKQDGSGGVIDLRDHATGGALRIEANTRAKNQELALGFARNMTVILSHIRSLAWD
jgi:hypothetical protein